MYIQKILKEFFNKLSIRRLFVLAILPFLAVSYFLIAVSIYSILYDHTKDLIFNQASQIIHEKTERFDVYFDELYEATDYLIYNPQMQQLLQTDTDTLDDGQEKAHRDIVIESLERGLSRHPYSTPHAAYINSIYLEDAFGERFVTDATYALREERTADLFTSVREEAVEYHGKPYIYQDNGLFYFARALYNGTIGQHKNQIGLLIIELDREIFSQIIDYDVSDGSISYVLADSDGHVISNLSELMNPDIEQLFEQQAMKISGTDYQLLKYTSRYGNLQVGGIINKTALYEEFNKTYFSVILLIFLSIVFVGIAIMVASWVVTGRFRRFISKLNKTDVIDETALIHTTSGGEFQELEQVYNNMLVRVDGLTKSLHVQQLANKDSEFKALQAQINPHFLYNTLDCINSLIDVGNHEDAKKTVVYLGQLMRMSIKGSDIITVAREEEYIRQYIFIQKMRYQNRALFLVEIPRELLIYDIPKLVLQPIVENAILHGIADKTEQGMVAIFGEEKETCIMFHVKDNGGGIDRNMIERINNFSTEDAGYVKEHSSIGLLNIQKRVRLLYGKEYGLVINPLGKGGTEVTVRLPKLINQHSTFAGERD